MTLGASIVSSYVQKITFVLPLVISDVIVAAVSKQCPQGPPIWEFSRLNVAGPKVHNKPGVVVRAFLALRAAKLVFVFENGHFAGLSYCVRGVEFGEAHMGGQTNP